MDEATKLRGELREMFGELKGEMRAAIEAHGRTTGNEVAALRTTVVHLGTQLTSIATKVKEHDDHLQKHAKAAQQSAHDLSNYKSDQAFKEEAMVRHIKSIEDGQKETKAEVTELRKEVTDYTKGQNDVLSLQTKSLNRIERLGPIIIAVATAVGAYFSYAGGQRTQQPQQMSAPAPAR